MKKIFWTIALIALAACALFAGSWLQVNRLPVLRGQAEIFVRPGTSPEQVIGAISDCTAIKWPKMLERTMCRHEVATYCKPGHYVIEADKPAIYICRMLNNGWQTPVHVVLSGTLRRKPDIARKISRQLMLDSAEVHQALNSDALLSKYGFTSENVFALMVPDTYEMYWTASMEDFFDIQKKAYDAFWTEENKAKAAAQGLTPMEVSILASIVKGESNHIPEFPKIAGVYLNRLHDGMRLQADPTIAYLMDYDVIRIYNWMMKIESPYNTYLHEGLPPAPIYVPTKETLNAVLNPDYGGGNMFFCADSAFNGTHKFAKTYDEHVRNAKAYRAALNARLAARKAAEAKK